LDLHKLESLPIFEHIVHKLMQRQSPVTIAKWCLEQKVDVCGYYTWKRRIESLNAKLKAQIKTIEPQDLVKVARPAIQQLFDRREGKKTKEYEVIDAVRLVQRVDQAMMASLASITAETAVKSAYVMQFARCKQMVDIEASLGMPFSWGHKNIEALARIGESLRKLEAGEFSNHGRRDKAFGPNTRGWSPHVPEGGEPAGRYKSPLDGVDPELIRAAGESVRDLIRRRTAMKSQSGIHD
jgi:hypothetical protein